jgi:molecular chaperone DnaK
VFTKLVERNTTIPCHKSETFSTAEDNQPGVDVHVFQGERPMARDNKSLGNFRLEGIKPAPRGLPRIEVSFDIDANGILNVSAKDQESGKEQKITITASTNLTKDDIDRMVKEAQSHADEDKKRKEEADTYNEADQLCYTAEHQLKELNGKVSETSKSRTTSLVEDIRRMVKEREDLAKVKRSTEELKTALQGIQQEIASQAASNGAGAGNGEFAGAGASRNASSEGFGKPQGGGPDIVDAEVL